MLRDVVLLTKFINDDDQMNYDTGYTEQIIRAARITELNGAQAQNNAIGKQYDHTYVIRLEGNFTADNVAFFDEWTHDSKKMEISQMRNHNFKTDIYCGVTKEKS